jgi:hypothetical protein
MEMQTEEQMAEMASKITDTANKIQAIMVRCQTGKDLLEASSAMAQSAFMADVLRSIDETKNQKYAYTLGKYLGDYMNKDPEKGILGYARYIESIVNNPKYAHMKAYHEKIRDVSLQLHHSEAYQSFIARNRAFMQDESEAALKVKQDIQSMLMAAYGGGENAENETVQ